MNLEKYHKLYTPRFTQLGESTVCRVAIQIRHQVFYSFLYTVYFIAQFEEDMNICSTQTCLPRTPCYGDMNYQGWRNCHAYLNPRNKYIYICTPGCEQQTYEQIEIPLTRSFADNFSLPRLFLAVTTYIPESSLVTLLMVSILSPSGVLLTVILSDCVTSIMSFCLLNIVH